MAWTGHGVESDLEILAQVWRLQKIHRQDETRSGVLRGPVAEELRIQERAHVEVLNNRVKLPVPGFRRILLLRGLLLCS